MRIAHAIRQYASELEVYDLLDAYVDTASLAQRHSPPLDRRLRSTQSVMEQIRKLFVALEQVSKSLDDRLRVAIKEALYVFTTALDQLRSLTRAAPAELSQGMTPASGRS